MFPRYRTLIAAAMVCLAGNAHATTFGLAGSLGASPPFGITSGGQTVTFTSIPGNQYVVESTGGLAAFSIALLDNSFLASSPLTLTFSTPVSTAISLPFVIEDTVDQMASLSVVTDTAVVYMFTATAPSQQMELQGLVTLTPSSPITSLTLTSDIPFGIGDLTIASATPVSVPEPMTLALLGGGALALLGVRTRADRTLRVRQPA